MSLTNSLTPDLIARLNEAAENQKLNMSVNNNGTEEKETANVMVSNADDAGLFSPSIPAPVLNFPEDTTEEDASPASPAMSIQNIPAELKSLNHWVGFKVKNGRKIPVDPKPSSVILELPAKINDPTTWGTFEEAATLVSKGLADAVGFAITKETGLIFVDIDCHTDGVSDLAEKKKIESFYASFAQQAKICDTYIETSISGKGLHLLAKGKLLYSRSERFTSGTSCNESRCGH